MIEEARLDVSKLLGSIGLPPLIASSHSHHHHRQQVHPHYHVIEYAHVHIDLLHSMHSMLDSLRTGTSLRLGLGVSGGDGRHHVVVTRVEKAWIMRQRRRLQQKLQVEEERSTSTKMNDYRDNNHIDDRSEHDKHDKEITNAIMTPQCNSHDKSTPKDSSAPASTKTKTLLVLTFQKLRKILHRAIVDQAISIHDTLKVFHEYVIPTTYTTELLDEWGIFVNDLCHTSLNNAPLLTLSRLSKYIDNLGSYLSFSLSVFLVVVDNNDFDDITSSSSCCSCSDSMQRSIQFAKERSAYLQSAGPISHLHQDEDKSNDDTATAAAMRQENRTTGSDDNIVLLKNLQDTFEAARISLWAAVGQSQQTSPDEDGIDDVRDWWTQFKYHIDRSCALIPVVETQYHLTEKTATVNKQRRKEGTNEDNADLVNNSGCNNVAEVLEDVGKSTTLLLDHHSDKLEYMDKTIVFSGSAIGISHNVMQNKIIREKTKSVSLVSDRPARAFAMMDQKMLLQDLERRLKSMGLVMEHEVIMDTLTEFGNAKEDDTISENPTKTQSNLLFLGASGSLLLELTSAINTNNTTSSLEDGYNDG